MTHGIFFVHLVCDFIQSYEIILNYECLSLLYHKKNLGLILFVPRQMSYSESKLPKLRHTVNFYEVRTNRRM